MTGRVLYNSLCEAANLDAAVARLGRDELATVAEYLADIATAGGVPAQVWGVVSARLNRSGGRRRPTTSRKGPTRP